MASLFPAARVVAVDLSLSSLAYAKRKIIEAGLDNIECYHGDILELGGLDRRFDVVTSSGVLHHMADPLAGWRVLTSLLKADGVMRIGLYSEAARRAIVAVRDLIAARGLASDAEGIRRCRADIMALPADDPMAAVALLHDFFALSDCRDLLFHVQEHRFTIPGLAAALNELGLEFLGFVGDRPGRAYGGRFPEDPGMRSLANWHVLETEQPDTFVGMYQFWCVRG